MGECKNCKKSGSCVEWLALLLSFLALAFSLFPQLNLYNTNYIDRANAGDADAQMFLAEHYFEVGDVKESHYWYKVAAMSGGDHQGTALNNVAYIGLTYGYYSESVTDYHEKALTMFKKAACYGDKTAVQNIYELLNSHKMELTGLDYEKELAWVIQVSYHFGIHIDGLSESEIKWALEQFQLNEHIAYATEEGWDYYDDIGIYPREDAFAEKSETYNSYVYRAESGT